MPTSLSAPYRALLTATLLTSVLLAGVIVERLWPDQVTELLTWVGRTERTLGAAGWVMAALVQVLIALCGIVPASIGAITAGMIYGTAGGFMLCGPATLAGAVIGFLLSRSLFRDAIAGALQHRPRMMRLNKAVSQEGWRLVCLLRISPVMPFAATSYALGLTSLGLREYLLGTLASLPALFLYVLLGDLAGAGLGSFSGGSAGILHWILLAPAMGATILVILRLGHILRQVFRLPSFAPDPN
jgi:uncharacterized membrane protein YdjX (TVP38/TMEM64 family)